MAEAAPTSTPEQAEPQQSRSRIRNFFLGTTAIGYIARGTLVPLLFYVAIFAVAFWRAWVDPEGSAAFFAYVRSLVDMIVSIAAILIVIATGVLIIQIARFVNLLRSEVKPITDDTKQAIRNVRVTSEFVQKNAVTPIIKTQSFVAGLITFLREIATLSKIMQQQNIPPDTETETGDD